MYVELGDDRPKNNFRFLLLAATTKFVTVVCHLVDGLIIVVQGCTYTILME